MRAKDALQMVKDIGGEHIWTTSPEGYHFWALFAEYLVDTYNLDGTFKVVRKRTDLGNSYRTMLIHIQDVLLNQDERTGLENKMLIYCNLKLGVVHAGDY